MSVHRILDPQQAFRVPSKLCALGIMTKAPQAGKVKKRLTPPLTTEEAAELNVCFLRDLSDSISEACKESSACGVGVYTPVGAEAVYETILPSAFFLIPQKGENFSERLILAATDLFRVGFESVCLINSDSPTVPTSCFAEAAQALAKTGDRLVLGPSDDGGYYLIGLKQAHRRLFEEIAWSTEHVLAQTRERAAELSLPIHELPGGFDVDDQATLRRLCDELLGSDARLTSNIAVNTRNFLQQFVAREGRDRVWPQ